MMAQRSNNSIYAFDQFGLDVSNLMLYRDGEAISLPRKVVKTLAVLVETRGAIISKDDLIDRVWEDSIVEEANLTQHLYLLRKTLGTKPDGSSYIETLRRRGYRFTGNVQIIERLDAENENVSIGQPKFSASAVERHGNVLRFVDRHELELPANNEPPGAVVPSTAAPLRTPRIALFFAGLTVAALATLAFVFFGGSSSNAVEMSVVKLTDGPRPSGATIAPDGDYFAYLETDGFVESAFIQQVGQSNRLAIISSDEDDYQSITFSNDGRFVYIVTTDKERGRTWLMRVPSIGGSPVRVLDQINGPVSFSPDGKEMTFTRVGKNRTEWSIVIADFEGKGERTLLVRNEPTSLGFAPSWSPDGKLIAVSEWATRQPLSRATTRLLLVDVEDGNARELSAEDWATLYRLVWTSDGNGIVMIATRWNETYSTRRDNVYFVSYPDGKSNRISTDGNRYDPESLGVTKNGGIVALPYSRSSQIWAMSATGDEKTAYQITRGSADGRAGLNVLSDGRLAYVARSGDELNTWVSRSDGTDARQLGSGLNALEETRADPAGKYLVFSTPVESKSHLFRIDVDGNNLKQLTFGEDQEVDSDILPDGNAIIYASAKVIAGVYHHRLWSIPSEGGEPRQFVNFECSRPLVAPDGKKLSCVTASEEVVIMSTDGTEIERFKLPANSTSNYGIGWLPNSRALGVIVMESGRSNLWSYPLNKGKPLRLTNFTSGTIYRYAFSPDGTRLYLARGYPTQDAVLITNYR